MYGRVHEQYWSIVSFTGLPEPSNSKSIVYNVACRGGFHASTHVEILQNTYLFWDVLQIAAVVSKDKPENGADGFKDRD